MEGWKGGGGGGGREAEEKGGKLSEASKSRLYVSLKLARNHNFKQFATVCAFIILLQRRHQSMFELESCGRAGSEENY